MFIAGDFVLGFFVGGDSREGGGVAGLWMIGDGEICHRWSLHCDGSCVNL